MIETQVSLEEQDYEAAKKQAEAEGISLAELIRRALRDQLSAEPDKPWMQYIGIIEDGDPNPAESIDDIVYLESD